MSINKNQLLDMFYECETYYRLNSGNESVDIKELIILLKALEEADGK